ncbi:hypothetical protein [Bacillus pinisoli]|uniref:hypothetical protein n=1 Tax=Bacillus pinisoli TaxID=2901866 RepID=UPI001FF5733D|nr:hypothetical protein [Bacillus pinisoli]
MRKYGIIAALILLIVILLTLYIYRVQDLDDVLNIEQVDRILLTTEERELNGVEIPRVSQEQLNQLAKFLNQYQVRLSMKKGWSSDYPREQFTLRIVYKSGDYEIYTFERDVVATTRIYKVVNDPLDYKWIQEFERDLNSN